MATTSATSRSLVEGPLSKWTNVVSGWQYRWFVLDQASGMLSYYTSKDKMTRGSRRGCIALKKAILGIDDEEESTFTIHVDGRTFHFQAQNAEERERWIQALDSTIRRILQPVKRLELNLPLTKRGLSVESRLAICDSYHALLMEQIESLSAAMNTSEEAARIRHTAQEMLTSLRQCIDIMKEDHAQGLSPLVTLSSLAHTASGVSTPQTGGEEEEEEEEEKKSTSALDKNEKLSEEEEEEDRSDEDPDSSGDDSDIFVDAEEGPSPVVTSPSVSIPAPQGDPPDVEECSEYSEEDDIGGSVAAHKSLIMYMLSQVKVGMDLTRVTLPTFILEKRSLLEMYGDFMAHPDVFASINDYSDPKQRMVAGIRYFLSSFHCARQGTIPKKPYNPILGEIFRCYWDLPDGSRIPPSAEAKQVIESGPVPFSNYCSVTFLAEQVSHHPPVSGFYAECPSKRMFVNGSIYTKSKFLGLSLGVHLIGTITLMLMDHGEEYICTLPNAYARSILTYPWMELGGKCNVRCPQSGYYADVEFHCKPFYGGRKHRVTADIYHESEKKSLLKIDGEWNGVMNMRTPGSASEEQFVDVLALPTIRKKIQKLTAQDSGESRRRWIKVTKALAKGDEQGATDAKHELEEKQRADARERQATGQEWQRKYFHLEGDRWVYNTPLPKRLATPQPC